MAKAKPVNLQTPLLGIYWWHRGKLITFTEPFDAVKPAADARDSDLGHYNVWVQVQKAHPELREKEYYEVPRGRVLYQVPRDEFWLFAPIALHTKATVIARIIRHFRLPKEKVRLQTDHHYEPPEDDLFDDEGE